MQRFRGLVPTGPRRWFLRIPSLWNGFSQGGKGHRRYSLCASTRGKGMFVKRILARRYLKVKQQQQQQQQPTTTNNNNQQQPTTTNNNQQQPTTTNNNQQQPTTTNNNQQQPTTTNNNNNNQLEPVRITGFAKPIMMSIDTCLPPPSEQN